MFLDLESNRIYFIKRDTTCEHNYTFNEFSTSNSKYIYSHTLGNIFITISKEDPNIGLIQEYNGNNTKIYSIKEDKIIGYLN